MSPHLGAHPRPTATHASGGPATGKDSVARTDDPADQGRHRRTVVSPVAWSPTDELDHRDWLVEGRRIAVIARGSLWWVGDWLNYGTARWGESYTEAAKATGYDQKTLRNVRYVASRFHPSLRRDTLTWSHHALLAALPRGQQAYWLDRAVADGFTVSDLRIELRSAEQGRYRSECDSASPALDGRNAEDMLLCPMCGYRFSPGASR